MKYQKLWMAISGMTGFSFFLIANFTNFFVGLSVIAGVLQLCVNVFVFVVWSKAFLAKTGFDKYWVLDLVLLKLVIPIGKITTTCGVVIPSIMAVITLCRVLLPLVLH